MMFENTIAKVFFDKIFRHQNAAVLQQSREQVVFLYYKDNGLISSLQAWRRSIYDVILIHFCRDCCFTFPTCDLKYTLYWVSLLRWKEDQNILFCFHLPIHISYTIVFLLNILLSILFYIMNIHIGSAMGGGWI